MGEFLGDGQAEAGAAVLAGGGGVGLFKGLEEAAHLFVGEADAGVGDGEVDKLAVVVFVLYTSLDDDFALLGEFDGVIAEIDEDLAEAKRVAFRVSVDHGVDVEDELEAFGGGFFGDEVADIFENFVEVEVDVFDGQFTGFDFREVENVVDDAEQMLARLLNLADVTFLAGIEVGFQGEVGHADDGVHRSADFVRHVGEKFGFHAGGGFGNFLGLAEFDLGGFEGFGLGASLFEQAARFEIAGEKLGIHGHGGKEGVQEGLLAFGERSNGGNFEDADKNFVIQDGNEEEIAGSDDAEAGGDANGVFFTSRDHESAELESGLANETLAEFVFDQIGGLDGVGADAAELDRSGVGCEIEGAVEKRDAFGDTGEEVFGESGKVVGGLQAKSGGGSFGLQPGLVFAFTSALLESAERAADFADFIAAIDEGDGHVEFAGGEGLNGIANGPEFADDVDVEEVGGEGQRNKNAQDDGKPEDTHGAPSFESEGIGLLLRVGLHVVGDGDKAIAGSVEFVVHIFANHGGGFGVVVDEGGGADGTGVDGCFLEDVGCRADAGSIGGTEANGFINGSEIVGVRGVDVGVDAVHGVEIGFHDDLV